LVTEGTIDEVVDRRISDKVERLGEILSDADVSTMSLPDEEVSVSIKWHWSSISGCRE
jgi:hypothetical protein